jgi:hypothetical protein
MSKSKQDFFDSYEGFLLCLQCNLKVSAQRSFDSKKDLASALFNRSPPSAAPASGYSMTLPGRFKYSQKPFINSGDYQLCPSSAPILPCNSMRLTS